MNNKVILLILLASIVIQLVMLFTKKFATSIFISGGTLAVISLFKIYDASSRRRIKARTIDRERADIVRRGGNPTFVNLTATKLPLIATPTDNEDETFETPPQSLRSSQTTSYADSDELSRGSSTWNPEQQTNEKSVMEDQQETDKLIQDVLQSVRAAVREDLTNRRL